MAMLIQLMNATKELKIITHKLNNFDFGARIGMLISIVSPSLTYTWLLLVNNETEVLYVMSLLFASLLYDGKNIYVCVREQHMYMITFILSKSC